MRSRVVGLACLVGLFASAAGVSLARDNRPAEREGGTSGTWRARPDHKEDPEPPPPPAKSWWETLEDIFLPGDTQTSSGGKAPPPGEWIEAEWQLEAPIGGGLRASGPLEVRWPPRAEAASYRLTLSGKGIEPPLVWSGTSTAITLLAPEIQAQDCRSSSWTLQLEALGPDGQPTGPSPSVSWQAVSHTCVATMRGLWDDQAGKWKENERVARTCKGQSPRVCEELHWIDQALAAGFNDEAWRRRQALWQRYLSQLQAAEAQPGAK